MFRRSFSDLKVVPVDLLRRWYYWAVSARVRFRIWWAVRRVKVPRLTGTEPVVDVTYLSQLLGAEHYSAYLSPLTGPLVENCHLCGSYMRVDRQGIEDTNVIPVCPTCWNRPPLPKREFPNTQPKPPKPNPAPPIYQPGIPPAPAPKPHPIAI
jgi:hypothetical protein